MVRELQQVLRAQRSLENDAHLLAQRPQGIRVEDIAAFLGLTRERVRQVQNETLIKLKRYFQRHHITQEALL